MFLLEVNMRLHIGMSYLHIILYILRVVGFIFFALQGSESIQDKLEFYVDFIIFIIEIGILNSIFVLLQVLLGA